MFSTRTADFENRPPSPSSSESSFDDDEANRRITPHWPLYRNILKSRGFRLDTVRDVKEYYHRHTEPPPVGSDDFLQMNGFLRACANADDDALCPDAGLVRFNFLIGIVIY